LQHPPPTISPTIVTMTDPYEAAFALEDVRAKVGDERRRTGEAISVVGARVRLASGQAVKLRRKIDVDNEPSSG